MAHQWTWDDPGSVDLGCMSSATTDLTSASSKFSTAGTTLTGAKSSVSSWSGVAADAWNAAVDSLVTDLSAHRQQILDAKTAISTYRSTCLSISNRAATAKAQIADANRDYAKPQPDPINEPTEYQQWQNDRYMAGYDLQNARDEIYRLALERESADGDAVRALSDALPPNWSDTVAALASVGITGVGDLTRSNNLDALTALSQRIADGDGSDADLAALSYLFGMYQNNESAMSQVFRDLGGESTIKLIDEIGDAVGLETNPEVAAALLLLAGSIRTGLAVGSANWTTAQARDFTSTMLSNETLNMSTDGNAAIAYLFSDSDVNPMGEEFTYQLALAIDRAERVDGLPISSYDPWASRGGNMLFFAENPDAYDRMTDGDFYGPPGLVDGVGQVFETLGEHPERAFDFIGSAGVAGDRIDYWYGQRDWSGPDGFEGPAGLWLGASQIDGGPFAGTYDVTIGTQEATMTGRILEALGGPDGNPTFLTESLTDAAANDLAGVITLHLDGIAQAFQGSEDGLYSSSTGPLLEFTDPVTGETRLIANLDSGVFSNVLGQVGGNAQGAITLQVGADSVSQQILAAAGTDPANLSGAIDTVVRLQGIVDGASSGAILGSAARSDAELLAMIESATGLVGDLAGFVPIPGSSLVGGSVGMGVGGLTDWWADSWYEAEQSYPTVEQQTDFLRENGRDSVGVSVAHLLYAEYGEALGLPAPPPAAAGAGSQQGWASGVLDTLATDHGIDMGGIRVEYEVAYDAGFGNADGASGG